MASAEIVKELINELSSDTVKTLRVRSLCRDNPGLIASAGLRLKTWSILLLGNNHMIDQNDNIEDMTGASQCLEEHVLDADVHRTRAEIKEFRTESWRSVVHNILKNFCLLHSIQYKQGMNEVNVFSNLLFYH